MAVRRASSQSIRADANETTAVNEVMPKFYRGDIDLGDNAIMLWTERKRALRPNIIELRMREHK